MTAHLSKSRILSGLQCMRRLWLEINRPELVKTSPSTERLFRMGHQLNDVVHNQFPGGILIDSDHALSGAIRETDYQLRTHPERPLFEATFSKHNVLIRADVLLREAGGFHLIEVKSSTTLKPYHVSDCAIQAWVMREAGHKPERITLAHIDNMFVYPGGHNYHGIPLRVTYHPSYLLRQPSEKRKTWEDVQEVMKVLNGDVPPGF